MSWARTCVACVRFLSNHKGRMFFVVVGGPRPGVYLNRREAEKHVVPGIATMKTCSTFNEARSLLDIGTTSRFVCRRANVNVVFVGVAERRYQTAWALYYGAKDGRNRAVCEHERTGKWAHLKAIREAMSAHVTSSDRRDKLRIVTPSLYAANCVRRYAHACARSQFKQANGNPVPYQDLLRAIVDLKDACDVSADHVSEGSMCEGALAAANMARNAVMSTTKPQL